MSRQGKSICAAFAALGFFACAAVGIWLAVAKLPGIFDSPPEIGEGDPSLTWLGQGVGAAYGFGFLLVVIIYAAKRWIPRFALSIPAAVFWYCLGIACSLPYIWFLVVLDWQNPFVYRVSGWIYDPIAIWAVPTASFGWDVMSRTPWTSKAYLFRSFVEIIIVIPAWVVSWMFVSFLFLGGGWI